MAISTDQNPQDPESSCYIQQPAKVIVYRVNQRQLQQQIQPQKQHRHRKRRDQDDNSQSQLKNSFVRASKYINTLTIFKLILFVVVLVLAIHRILSTCMSSRRWLNAPITYMSRTCPKFLYEPMSKEKALDQNICITTLTDIQSPSVFQRFVRWRNFDRVLDITWDNKVRYANKYGYHMIDQSHLIDTSRPPAWSKIKAVLDLLANETLKCDWVMWTDADTLVMNSNIRITDFLPESEQYDLLVASDKGGGYNSGVFLFRNTAWSKQYLTDWWNKKDFVKIPGLSLSGDNAAMKDQLKNMDAVEFNGHVLSPPRCTFNSFAKFLSLHQSLDVMDKLDEQDWFMDNEHYHKGDFIAHTPGVDNKAAALSVLLEEAKKYYTN